MAPVQLLCGCTYCDAALLQFYFDYLTVVRNWAPSEVYEATMSQWRTLEAGANIIQHFSDTLFKSDSTVTIDGDELVRVWEVATGAYLCDKQLAIWQTQMVARKLIDE